MEKQYRTKKAENGGPGASSRPASGGGGGSSAARESRVVDTTATEGPDDNGTGTAAGNSEESDRLGRHSSDDSASGVAREGGDGITLSTTSARGGLVTIQPQGITDDPADGVGVPAAKTLAEFGRKIINSGPGCGDIGFEDEEDEDCSWRIPEAAAPKAVWQGHVGPVTRIGSCGQPPCFFSLGEVCSTGSHGKHSDFASSKKATGNQLLVKSLDVSLCGDCAAHAMRNMCEDDPVHSADAWTVPGCSR